MKKGVLKNNVKFALAIAAVVAPAAVGLTGTGMALTGLIQRENMVPAITAEYVDYQQENIAKWKYELSQGIITKEEYDANIEKFNTQEAFLLVSDSEIAQKYNAAEDLSSKGVMTATAGLVVEGGAIATTGFCLLSKLKKEEKEKQEASNKSDEDEASL